MNRPTQWQINQWIYWGSDEQAPRCVQMGLYATPHPDGVLIGAVRPDGGNGELLIPFDAASTLSRWLNDHEARFYAIFSKLVSCPECGDERCALTKRNYPGSTDFQHTCSNGHQFATNYQGYWSGEPGYGDAPNSTTHAAYSSITAALRHLHEMSEEARTQMGREWEVMWIPLNDAREKMEAEWPDHFPPKEPTNEDLGDLDDQPF
jgi:hypothetical protein